MGDRHHEIGFHLIVEGHDQSVEVASAAKFVMGNHQEAKLPSAPTEPVGDRSQVFRTEGVGEFRVGPECEP